MWLRLFIVDDSVEDVAEAVHSANSPYSLSVSVEDPQVQQISIFFGTQIRNEEVVSHEHPDGRYSVFIFTEKICRHYKDKFFSNSEMDDGSAGTASQWEWNEQWVQVFINYTNQGFH
uniref:Uncharacterized protein n=1 Tax=Ditylenchus dipsaci TaxID=166011 RepID=A0A915DFY9_9BILA